MNDKYSSDRTQSYKEDDDVFVENNKQKENVFDRTAKLKYDKSSMDRYERTDPSNVTVSGEGMRLVGVNESAEFSLFASYALREDDVRVDAIGESIQIVHFYHGL